MKSVLIILFISPNFLKIIYFLTYIFVWKQGVSIIRDMMFSHIFLISNHLLNLSVHIDPINNWFIYNLSTLKRQKGEEKKRRKFKRKFVEIERKFYWNRFFLKQFFLKKKKIFQSCDNRLIIFFWVMNIQSHYICVSQNTNSKIKIKSFYLISQFMKLLK